jgi:uncharacterized SAM-binding protein YcdF (DUF218 family)
VCALILCIATLTLLGTPVVSVALIDSLQIYPVVDAMEAAKLPSGPPTAIVILSAGRRVYAPEFGGETVDELSLERIRYGAKLARETRLPVLVTGGPVTPDEPALARLMAKALSDDFGIMPKWLEMRASNTAENAVYSARLLKAAGIKRVLLVTHAWHMKRASAAFAANGLSVIQAPTAFYRETKESSWENLLPSMHALRMSGYAIHEIVGNQWYALHHGY